MNKKCSACGTLGHMKTNKKCPMYKSYKEPVVETAVESVEYNVESNVESDSNYDSSNIEENEYENEEEEEEEELQYKQVITEVEIQQMRDKLSQLSVKNPQVLTDPIDNYHDDLIAQMSVEELQARLKMVRRACNSQMNHMITKNIIRIANNGVGLVTGKGADNLNKTTLNDPILIDTANNYISDNVLDLLADEIKLGIVYSSHVANDILTPVEKDES